ncbi:trichohyalin-like isoform X6 [Crassostrea angulata]|uniref:trichohyalin-like isoform X6 n=1 Tax=Magallana angulata TaxID=2784310 RepID=UPI0022B0D944|nr:trichohyalin-like isoform X6 [Crassostrea angulata]
MCAAMVDRNPEYPDYGRPMYDSNPQNDYGRPAYESYQQPGDYRRGQEYGQERYNPTSQYPGSSDPPVPDDLQITSGLVSLSDEKAKERRHLIQMEMRKEYEDHMRRQKPVYYTTGSVDDGLPIGNYAQARKVLDTERHRDYNKYMKEKEEQANRHRDEMMRQQHASPPHPANQTEMYDHNQMSQQLREERRKEYNDYLDDHKRLDLKSIEGDRTLGTPSKQQKEQILNRAQHQLEIPVIDRRQPNSDPPPPINPPQDRPPSGRWDPQSYRQSNFDQVKRVTSPPHQANIGHDDYGAFRRQTEHEVRNKEYNDFLAKKQHLEDEKKQKLADQRRQAPAPIVKGDYYDSEQYDRRRQALNDLQHREYQNYLKNGDPSNQTSAPHSYWTSLPMVESELKYNEFRKKQEKQRNWDYNVLLKHDQQRNRAPTPDHLQGLPLSQRQYDSMRKMQEKQRNQEYNDLLAKKGFNQHQPPETNRRPELGLKSEFQDQYQDPAALLTNRGRYSELEQYSSRRDNQARSNFDSHVQIAPQAISSDQVRTNSGKVKYYGLMTETQEQYRNPVTKNLDKGPKMGKEPAGRQSQRNAPVGSLIAGDRVDYPSSANERFNRERRKDYNDYIKPQDLKNIHRKREEAIAKIESDGIDMDKVRIFPQGEYVERHKQLQEEWRKNFRDFAAKKYEIVKKDLQERERVLASYNQKEIDNPTILPAGEYKEKQKHLQQQWRDECRDYYLGHPVVQRSKEIWREDEPVHTIPQSGEYKGRRKRLDAQLQKEFKEYQSQKTPPKERVKEFGSQGAVLFDPVYNKDVKNRMREERSKDLKDFLEKQEADRFRKQENTRPDNRIGFMTHLGRPVEEMREKLAKERHEEYNKYLKDKYISQPHQRPLERPKWVDSKLMEDNWQKEAAGSRSRPTSDKPIHTPTYEEMLDKKRREEASYRRFDDPEYSRSGADRGYDAQYRRYDQ